LVLAKRFRCGAGRRVMAHRWPRRAASFVDMEKNRSHKALRCIQVEEFEPTINEGYKVNKNNCATHA
jgi:hypothetical protein